MAKYKFEEFNVEIEDPEIEIKPVVREVDPINMTIAVDVLLISGKARFSLTLFDVKVQNLTYTSETLSERVMTRLKDFEVK